MIFHKNNWWWPQVYNEFMEYGKNQVKQLRSWNLCPKPDLTISFWALLSMTNFEDFILVFYIWVLHSTIEVNIKKKFNANNILLQLLGVWPKKKTMVSRYWRTFLVHFTMLAPYIDWCDYAIYLEVTMLSMCCIALHRVL